MSNTKVIGCSLSPYLFVICMNVLSALLNNAVSRGEYRYHPKCQNLGITHLCFADDIMVFTDGTIRSIARVIENFDKFAEMSGLRINLEKTTLYLDGVTDSDRQAIAASFPISLASLPICYLGLPLLTKRMTQSDYFPLLEKIRQKISKWPVRFLSFAGRLQLISSVLSGIIKFWCTAFHLPSSCLRELDHLFSAFLWSGSDLNPRKAKVTWAEVCLPKKEGGLGLRPLKEINTIYCIRLIWKLLSPKPSLWANWVHQNLIWDTSFWTTPTGNGSWIWRKILKLRDTALSFTHWNVNNGHSISFWNDDWSSLGRLIDITSTRGPRDLSIPLNSTVRQALDSHRRVRSHRSDAMNLVETALQQIAVKGFSESLDILLWRHGPDKFKPFFSSKLTWNQIRIQKPLVTCSEGIWFKYSIPKCALLTWLATKDRPTTLDRMAVWSPGLSTLCVLSRKSPESRNHLFFSCDFVAPIWTAMAMRLLGPRYTTRWISLLQILNDASMDMELLFLLRLVFQCSVYSIWRERNNRRHGKTPTPARRLTTLINKSIHNRISSIRFLGDPNLERVMVRWFAARSLLWHVLPDLLSFKILM